MDRWMEDLHQSEPILFRKNELKRVINLVYLTIKAYRL